MWKAEFKSCVCIASHAINLLVMIRMRFKAKGIIGLISLTL